MAVLEEDELWSGSRASHAKTITRPESWRVIVFSWSILGLRLPQAQLFERDLSGFRAGDRFLMVYSGLAPGLIFLKPIYLNVTCPVSRRVIVFSWSILGLLRDWSSSSPSI